MNILEIVSLFAFGSFLFYFVYTYGGYGDGE
jgi:hypothetical protein